MPVYIMIPMYPSSLGPRFLRPSSCTLSNTWDKAGPKIYAAMYKNWKWEPFSHIQDTSLALILMPWLKYWATYINYCCNKSLVQSRPLYTSSGLTLTWEMQSIYPCSTCNVALFTASFTSNVQGLRCRPYPSCGTPISCQIADGKSQPVKLAPWVKVSLRRFNMNKDYFLFISFSKFHCPSVDKLVI